MRTYQIWGSSVGDDPFLIDKDDCEDFRNRGLLHPDSVLVLEFEAASWEDAVARMDAHYGW